MLFMGGEVGREELCVGLRGLSARAHASAAGSRAHRIFIAAHPPPCTPCAPPQPAPSHRPLPSPPHTHASKHTTQASGLSQAGAARAWAGAAAHVEACVLDSVARVRSCSLEGRAAMTLDVQGVAHGLRRLAPLPVGAQAGLARADAYVKAFYIPVGELTQWALAHPEYTREQVGGGLRVVVEGSRQLLWQRGGGGQIMRVAPRNPWC